jgi:hypothetical protein
MGTALAILFIYIIYFVFTISKYDKNGHYKYKNKNYEEELKKAKKKEKEELIKEMKKIDYDKLPSEVKFFVSSYKVDLDKVNIRGLLKMTGLIVALCIGVALLVILIAMNKQDVTISIFVGFVITMVLYLISLKLLGIYFDKKGLLKDE